MLKEFRDFLLKGSVVDMAIGFIFGAAFATFVKSLVENVIMPPIGLLVGGVNFTDLKFVLKDAVGEIPAVTINYGNFIQVAFDFIIIAFSIFMVIKLLNAAKKKEEKVEEVKAPAGPTKEEVLLTEIRDLLKNK